MCNGTRSVGSNTIGSGNKPSSGISAGYVAHCLRLRQPIRSRWSLIYRRRCGRNRCLVIRVCVAGVTGWTGRAVAAAIEAADDLELAAGVSRSDPDSYSSVAEALDEAGADVLVDFTHASAVRRTSLPASNGTSTS